MTVLCPTCISDLLIGEHWDTIQATELVAVDYGGGLIRVRRGGAAIIVAPGQLRHPVDALVRMVEWQVWQRNRWHDLPKLQYSLLFSMPQHDIRREG